MSNEELELHCAFCDADLDVPDTFDSLFKCYNPSCSAVYALVNEGDAFEVKCDIAEMIELEHDKCDWLTLHDFGRHYPVYDEDEKFNPEDFVEPDGIRVDVMFGRQKDSGSVVGYIFEAEPGKYLMEDCFAWRRLDDVREAHVFPKLFLEKIQREANFWEIEPVRVYLAFYDHQFGRTTVKDSFHFELTVMPTKRLAVVIESADGQFFNHRTLKWEKKDRVLDADHCPLGMISFFGDEKIIPGISALAPKLLHIILLDNKYGTAQIIDEPIEFSKFFDSETLVIDAEDEQHFLESTMCWIKCEESTERPVCPATTAYLQYLREKHIENLRITSAFVHRAHKDSTTGKTYTTPPPIPLKEYIERAYLP
ncbi:hypothetical protein ACFL2B_02400 [Patescibacteria group bacterium]